MAKNGLFDKANKNGLFKPISETSLKSGKYRDLRLTKSCSTNLLNDQPGLSSSKLLIFIKHIIHFVSSRPGLAMQPSPPEN